MPLKVRVCSLCVVCYFKRQHQQADWGPSGGRQTAAPSFGEAEAEEEGSKSMVLTTHTIMKVRVRVPNI